MAREIIWSPTAISDVDEIAEYIARDSRIYARAVARRMVEAVERLPPFPRLGRQVPELNDPEIREVLVHNYRIIYRYDDQAITVAAVVHGARLLKNAIR